MSDHFACVKCGTVARGVMCVECAARLCAAWGSALYFVRDGNKTAVKVGLTGEDLIARMSAMQANSPVPLDLLFVLPGDRGDEARIHRVLGEHHASGEWFHCCPPVRRTISALSEAIVDGDYKRLRVIFRAETLFEEAVCSESKEESVGGPLPNATLEDQAMAIAIERLAIRYERRLAQYLEVQLVDVEPQGWPARRKRKEPSARVREYIAGLADARMRKRK